MDEFALRPEASKDLVSDNLVVPDALGERRLIAISDHPWVTSSNQGGVCRKENT